MSTFGNIVLESKFAGESGSCHSRTSSVAGKCPTQAKGALELGTRLLSIIFVKAIPFLLWFRLQPRRRQLAPAAGLRPLPLLSWFLRLSWPERRRVSGASHPESFRCREVR